MLHDVVHHLAIAERTERYERQAAEYRLRREARDARRLARRRALLWPPAEQQPTVPST